MAPGSPTSTSKPASVAQPWEGISARMATTSTELKCTTVGPKKTFIAARSFSVKTFAPIEAATNLRPAKVAAAVPTSPSKSCQASTRSAREECMVGKTGASGAGAIAKRWCARQRRFSSNVAANERGTETAGGPRDGLYRRILGGPTRETGRAGSGAHHRLGQTIRRQLEPARLPALRGSGGGKSTAVAFGAGLGKSEC